MGFTYLRIPIDPSFILPGLPVNGQTALSDSTRVAKGLSQLDAAVASFTQAGFAVMLVLQPQSSFVQLTDAQTEQYILQGVTLLSQRYAGTYTPDQVAFEALNEPQYDTTTWNNFAPAIVAAIRQNAPLHTIIMPPAACDIPDNFAYLTPMADTNVIYTMHMYDPVGATMQGTSLVTAMPYYRFPRPAGSTDTTEWTSKRLVAHMQLGFTWAAANNVPLIMNEFGATSIVNKGSRSNWILLVRKTAEAAHVGWAWWSFDSNLFGLRPNGGAWDPVLERLLSK